MKNISSISGALLAVAITFPVFAEDNILSSGSAFSQSPPVSSCAEWRMTVPIDTEALDKLQKNVAGDKPENGLAYTKKQFVVLLGKNLTKARDTLATGKSKLAKTSDGKVDLKDVTLEGFNLSGLNLDNVDFKGAEMNGVNLSGSSLREASLLKAELEGANLNNTNLSYANLSKSKLNNASLCHATLVSADLEDAALRGAYLKDAKLDMAKNIPVVIYQNSENILRLGLPVPEK